MQRRYTSPEEDSRRWAALTLRPGDVVISTRSKHGTTWVQAILLMLVHGPDLPRPLAELSPWVDHLVEDIGVVAGRLEAQRHRRVLKTHTPLDGLPWSSDVIYVVVARHPLDAAVSLYHQGANIDRARLAHLTGRSVGSGDGRPDLRTWLVNWTTSEADPTTSLDSLPGVLRHLTDAWWRRDQPNVLLLHYADLTQDLDAAIRRLAGHAALPPPRSWDEVRRAASLEQMRQRADVLAPDRGGVLKDRAAFFRTGGLRTGAQVLDDQQLAAYHARARSLAPEDLLTWLHR